ncbi:uncharacterized protein LOC125289885 [Alosa alosa]|uniref:uncharacterized protein LOC125289885 n=1 Tax=Alosa alosa TaxID=278164 RepID=UPI0020150F18|nr:uncharacterized protein LOC125289885 [Alosa alosa]XP_048092950.1 uncharacterized protein LOC125289885 [Alosa alosa]
MIGPERFQIIVALVPFLLLTLGALHLHNCPKEPMVPISVIVGSVFLMVIQLVAVCGCLELCFIPVFLILIFLFCWLIAGSVFIYRAFQPNFESRHSLEYCEKILYQSAFWCTNLAWVFIVVLGISGLCRLVWRWRGAFQRAGDIECEGDTEKGGDDEKEGAFQRGGEKGGDFEERGDTEKGGDGERGGEIEITQSLNFNPNQHLT